MSENSNICCYAYVNHSFIRRPACFVLFSLCVLVVSAVVRKHLALDTVVECA